MSNLESDKTYSLNSSSISINKYGAIQSLNLNKNIIVYDNEESFIDYVSYGKSDYDYWLSHYSRNLKQTSFWAFGDFSRPLLKYVDNKYRQGVFPYVMKQANVSEYDNKLVITIDLHIEAYFYDYLGTARILQIVYTLFNNELDVEVTWLNKDANRLTESTLLHFNFTRKNRMFKKIDTLVNPKDVLSNGSRNLSAVSKVLFDNFEVVNYHSPLVSVGKGKILKFDNKYESIEHGITFILHNNVWGTNFPLWYEDNAYFKFKIQKKEV